MRTKYDPMVEVRELRIENAELRDANAELLEALELIARIDITDGDMGAIAYAAIAKHGSK